MKMNKTIEESIKSIIKNEIDMEKKDKMNRMLKKIKQIDEICDLIRKERENKNKNKN